MDIKVLNSWLREYLDTNASNKELAKYLSLSGPTIDRTKPFGKDTFYEIEVTTNRVDAMSIYGIAREAAAILPFYGFRAKLKELPKYKKTLPQNGPELILKSNSKLTKRLMGVVIEDIKNWESPDWMVQRLESADIRSKNLVVDITNYVMLEVGHPCHVFDYDRLVSYKKQKTNHKIVVRESKVGEEITAFDGKKYTLSGGDIVFDDGEGNIIDLPGIIGTKNSVVGEDTKRVLFFFDTCSASHIRKTSMELAIRTNAAVLNEKGVDPELAEVALKRGLILFEELAKARIASPIYDIYHKPYKTKNLKLKTENINNILGINIDIEDIKKILESLGFSLEISGENLEISVPSYRASDIDIPEDIVEEIARVYGYGNIKGELMIGIIPAEIYKTNKFTWEKIIRDNLIKLGGNEVLTFSLVSKEMAGENAIKVSNPLGTDTEYLRTTLKNSLLEAAKVNIGNFEKYHIFELSNVFQEIKNDLPEEKMTLGGLFIGFEYFEAKGIIESFLKSLNINYQVAVVKRNKISFSNLITLEILKDKQYYYEANVEALIKSAKMQATFKKSPNFPAQIEDITISITDKQVGEVFETIKNNKNVTKVELVDIYGTNYTFRVHFQDESKTLTDKEVEEIREKLLKKI